MGDGTGIAGAQDYVPRSSGEDTWTCATCEKEVSWEKSSARAWIDKGLQQEAARQLYDLSRWAPMRFGMTILQGADAGLNAVMGTYMSRLRAYDEVSLKAGDFSFEALVKAEKRNYNNETTWSYVKEWRAKVKPYNRVEPVDDLGLWIVKAYKAVLHAKPSRKSNG